MNGAIFPIVTDQDDFACLDCNRILPIGTPYSTRLVALDDRFGEMLEVVCVYCVTGPAEYCPDAAQAGIDGLLG